MVGLPLVAAGEEPAVETLSVRLVPPWELPGPLVVVWPENLSRSRRLIPPTVELIQAVPEQVEVALASPRPPRVNWLQELGRDMRYLPLTTVRSREIGEWAGIAAATEEGHLFNMRFQLPVRDISSRDLAVLRDHDEASRQLGVLLYGQTQTDVPLRMGNLHLTHNGWGVALISNRVITENEGLSLVEIRKRLREAAGLETVLFVPVPESEPRGYIDGMVQFIGPRQLLVSEPMPGSATARSQHEDLLRLLSQELDDIDVIRIPRPSLRVPDAGAGNYLHLIQAGHVILVPQFDVPEDQPVLTLLRRQLDGVDIVPVSGAALTALRLNRIALWR